jgi:hypothetical protein
MLYDPKWEQQAKSDPYTLESLIAWLEKMPAGQAYDWHDCTGGCLIDQYAAAMGIEKIGWRGDAIRQIFGDLGYGAVCSNLSGPTTFGAALERARAALNK